MIKIPIVQISHELPPVPEHLLDEAEQLINVRFNGSGTLLQHLKLAYGFLDKVNAEVVSGFSSCSKGCSHCCNMDVQMTVFEAEYISMTTAIPLRYDAAMTFGHKSRCPFLSKDNGCTIYAVRPLFCRTYHSLSDPKLCGIPGAEIKQYGTMTGNMSNFAYEEVTKWVHRQSNRVMGSESIKDIRAFFPYKADDIHQHLRHNPPQPTRV